MQYPLTEYYQTEFKSTLKDIHYDQVNFQHMKITQSNTSHSRIGGAGEGRTHALSQ